MIQNSDAKWTYHTPQSRFRQQQTGLGNQNTTPGATYAQAVTGSNKTPHLRLQNEKPLILPDPPTDNPVPEGVQDHS
jgi:hypothetical protein